jgi:hypothetical protein
VEASTYTQGFRLRVSFGGREGGTCPRPTTAWQVGTGYNSVRALDTFISLILRWSVRRLMPSFLAAAVTLPFVAARA